MATQKFDKGLFVFYRVASSAKVMTPHEIELLTQTHHLPASVIPAYAGHRKQVTRALAQVGPQVGKHGWLLRPITQTAHRIEYGIVREVKGQKLDYAHTYTLEWSDEGGNGAHITSKNSVPCEVIAQVDAAYQAIKDCICPGDWTESICAYLGGECQGQMIRPAVYYIPPQRLREVQTLATFLQAVGLQLLICELEPEAVAVVQQAASETLAQQLETLQAQVNAFDGTQKPSNYQTRIAEIVALKSRAEAYKGALGIGVEHAQALLAQLEAQVSQLLDVRQQTVVHRSGKVSGSGSPGSKPVDTLAQSFGPSIPLHHYEAGVHAIARAVAQEDRREIPSLTPTVAQANFAW